MADFPAHRHTDTGDTLYAVVRNAAGQHWDVAGAAFETLVPGSWGDYDIAMAESPAGGYQYVAAVPAALAAGWVLVDVYLRAGGAPAITDTLLATGLWYYDGSAVVVDGLDTALADGIAPTTALAAMMAALFGKAAVAGATVSFKKRDGATEIVNVTHDAAGNRTAGTLTP